MTQFIISGPILTEVLRRRQMRIQQNYRKWLKGGKVPKPNPVGPAALKNQPTPNK